MHSCQHNSQHDFDMVVLHVVLAYHPCLMIQIVVLIVYCVDKNPSFPISAQQQYGLSGGIFI